MNRSLLFFLSFLALSIFGLSFMGEAQSETDAIKMGQSVPGGTARSMAMGGAFGALGADASAYDINPAGLAIYRSYDLSMTLSSRSNKAISHWNGHEERMGMHSFGVDNFAFTGYIPKFSSGIMNFNLGINYRKIMDFHRQFSMGSPESPNHESLGKYIANLSNGIPDGELQVTKNGFNAYSETYHPWLSILGYGAYLIDPDTDRSYVPVFGEFLPGGSALTMNESGDISAYDIGFAMNISDYLFLGSSISFVSMNYSLSSDYKESFTLHDGDGLELQNNLKTQGAGFSASFGVIFRPFHALRLGASYQTKTIFVLKDYPYSSAYAKVYIDGTGSGDINGSGNTPMDVFFEYRYSRPSKLTLSVASIIGRSALLSFDYERTQYGGATFGDIKEGVGSFQDINTATRNLFKTGNMFRLGAEVKPIPQLAVRGGFAYTTRAIKDTKTGGEMSDIHASGTIPHFVLPQTSRQLTFGLGYRINRNWYIDAAAVISHFKDEVFAYPTQHADGGAVSSAATLDTKQVKLAFTAGYKF